MDSSIVDAILVAGASLLLFGCARLYPLIREVLLTLMIRKGPNQSPSRSSAPGVSMIPQALLDREVDVQMVQLEEGLRGSKPVTAL